MTASAEELDGYAPGASAQLGHELCNDYNTLPRWPTLYCLPWGEDSTAVLAVRIPRRPEEMREMTMLEILQAIDRILVDAPNAYRELAAAASE
ncbi:MAG TPA: hypothetical protein VGF93_04490 [Solirubrobacteraceae bacterium]